MTSKQRDILAQKIGTDSFSASFTEQSRLMGFQTVADILKQRPDVLLHHREFSYTWLAELSSFLSAKGLLHLLQSTAGNTAG